MEKKKKVTVRGCLETIAHLRGLADSYRDTISRQSNEIRYLNYEIDILKRYSTVVPIGCLVDTLGRATDCVAHILSDMKSLARR